MDRKIPLKCLFNSYPILSPLRYSYVVSRVTKGGCQDLSGMDMMRGEMGVKMGESCGDGKW